MKVEIQNNEIVADIEYLMEFLSATRNTIEEWIKQGLPNFKNNQRRGNPISFYLKEAVNWYIEKNFKSQGRLDLNQETAKKTRIQRKILELEYQEKLGELLSMREIIQKWESILTVIKSRLLDLPDSLTYHFNSIKTEEDLREIVFEEVNTILENLSTFALYEETQQPISIIQTT